MERLTGLSNINSIDKAVPAAFGSCANDFQADLLKAQATHAINDGDKPLQLRGLVGADQHQPVTRRRRHRRIELLVEDGVVVHKQTSLRRHRDDQRRILPILGGMGRRQVDRILSVVMNVAVVKTMTNSTSRPGG